MSIATPGAQNGAGGGAAPVPQYYVTLISGHDITTEVMDKIAQEMSRRGYTPLQNEQFVIGDFSDPAMTVWMRAARTYRMKTVPVVSDSPEEPLATLVYAHILWKSTQTVHTLIPMVVPVMLVSLPQRNSGAYNIFSTMCEKLHEMGIVTFAVGMALEEDVPQQLLRDCVYISVSPDGAHPRHSSGSAMGFDPKFTAGVAAPPQFLIGSSTVPSTSAHHPGVTVDDTWTTRSGFPTRSSELDFEVGCMPHQPLAIGTDTFDRAVGPASAGPAVVKTPSAISESVHSTVAPEVCQRNFDALKTYLTRQVQSRAGPPFATLGEVCEMAQRLPLPGEPNHRVVASDFGQYNSFAEVIGAIGELVVGEADTIEALSRTSVLVIKMLKSGAEDLMDTLVVRAQKTYGAQPRALGDTNSDQDTSEGESTEPAKSRSHPRSTFANYEPLATTTKLELYPIVHAIYDSVQAVRKQVMASRATVSSIGVPLSLVVQYIVTRFPGEEYQYKTYGFGKMTGLLAEVPEIFAVSQGPGHLPYIMWVHNAPRRLAWMRQNYANQKPHVPASGGTAASAPASTPASATVQVVSPSEHRRRLAAAKKLLVDAIKELTRQSGTNGSDGFLPSIVVNQVSEALGAPFDPKVYGHQRLKSLVLALTDAIEWFQKKGVDYLRLTSARPAGTQPAAVPPPAVPPKQDAAVAVAPPAPRKTTYAQVLNEPPPPYSTPNQPPPPLNAGPTRRAGDDREAANPIACSDDDDDGSSSSSSDKLMQWVQKKA